MGGPGPRGPPAAPRGRPQGSSGRPRGSPGRPRELLGPPWGSPGRPRELPKRIRSVFKNVKKQLVFALFLNTGGFRVALGGLLRAPWAPSRRPGGTLGGTMGRPGGSEEAPWQLIFSSLEASEGSRRRFGVFWKTLKNSCFLHCFCRVS